MKSEIINRLAGQMKGSGYKLTNQRLAVIDVFSDHESKHLTCEEIYDYIRQDYPDIGLATVYRVVKLFCELELIHKIEFGDGFGRYEVNLDGKNHTHHHIICTKCGKVLELKEDMLESLEEQVLKENDFLVTGHTVKFYGVCGDCR